MSSNPDIIEINLKNLYIRPNWSYIISRMEDGAIVIVHQREDALILAQNMRRKNYKYGFTKENNGTWKIFIKEGKDNVVVHSDEKYEKIFKSLKEGGTITGKNRGDLMVIVKMYRESFSDGKQKIAYKKEEGGYSIWLE